jgi:hypothetical protein
MRASPFFTFSNSSPNLPARSRDPTGSVAWRVRIVEPAVHAPALRAALTFRTSSAEARRSLFNQGKATHMRKIHLAASALAIAVALAPLSLQAANLSNTVATLRADGGTQIVMAKHHHRHMSRGPGRCGENMFWSGKEGHCLDARDKAA